MRIAPTLLSVALGLAAGCLGKTPDAPAKGSGGNGPVVAATDGGVAADLAAAPDLAPRPMPDLMSTDLAGLVNCFGRTVCDPTMEFCLQLFPGSQTTPGTALPPACYQPADCMGAAMDCDCLTQDATLSAYCATCVDNMDGTFNCYAQQ